MNISPHSPSRIRRTDLIAMLLLLLAAVLIALGTAWDEPAQTRRNAHYLCLECIGIG